MGEATLSKEYLHAIPLFRGIEPELLSELASRFERVTAAPGEKLFSATEPAEALFVLCAGEVSIGRNDTQLHLLRPPAVIGELGAITGIARTSDATASADSEVWRIGAEALRGYVDEHPGAGGTMMGNLLAIVADKVGRDQQRLEDMRGNIIRTQKAMKKIREYLLESEDTQVSEFVHGVVEEQIKQNRRVNYRVVPPPAHPATFRADGGTSVPVVEISRNHISVVATGDPSNDVDRITGVLDLDGIDIAISGKMVRTQEDRFDIEVDLLVDEYTASLEGYLTRVQLLDFLV